MSSGLGASPGREMFDLGELVGLEMEIEDVEVGPHVVGARGAGEGEHADIECESEGDLGDGSAVAFGDQGDLRTGQERSAVGCQQGEPLVDNSTGGTELPDVAVPGVDGIAAVLDKTGLDARLLAEELELFEGDVAEEPRATAIVDGFHARQASQSSETRPS